MRLTSRGLPALLGRLLKLPAAKGVRASTRHVRRLSRLIDDLPISAKAFAASSVLLLCLIGLGANGYLALSRAAIGLSRHSDIELPKQRTASELASQIVATHLTISRFVAWAQIGVAANTQEATRGELLGQLDILGKRLQLLGAQANLPPSEMELLSAQWGKYVREIGDVIAVAASDPPMASMLLSATDDEFQSIAAKLQGIAGLVANQTRATSQDLAKGPKRTAIFSR